MGVRILASSSTALNVDKKNHKNEFAQKEDEIEIQLRRKKNKGEEVTTTHQVNGGLG